MIDIETTGTDPHNAAIIQICAVKFNLDTQEVSSNVFNRCLSMKSRRFWDEDTKKWWGKMPDLYKSIAARMENPEKVMKDLIDWVGTDELRFWGKPITFDFSFIDSYYKDYGLNNPFHWRNARDLNSYIAGLRHSAQHPDTSYVEFEGTAHDAFYDTFHQIKMLFAEADRNVQATVI
jgi:oligoribonuclease (3'-5' exoribonuclease)